MMMMMEFLVGDDKEVVEWKEGRKELDSGMLLSLSHISQASERAGPQLLTTKTKTTTTKTTGREGEEKEQREKQRTTPPTQDYPCMTRQRGSER